MKTGLLRDSGALPLWSLGKESIIAIRLMVLAMLFLSISVRAHADLIRSRAGANPAAIQSVVDQFTSDLGAARREINWDGVPDDQAAPNLLPGDFFHARGAVFSTPGQGVQVSADSSNPTSTAVRFGHINPTYSDIFQPFSAERLFSPIGSFDPLGASLGSYTDSPSRTTASPFSESRSAAPSSRACASCEAIRRWARTMGKEWTWP